MVVTSFIVLVSLVLHLLAIYTGSLLPLVAGSIILAFSWLSTPAWNTLTMESVEDEKRGLALSLIMFMSVFPEIFFSPLGGWLVREYGYILIFIIGICMEAICFFAMLFFIEDIRVGWRKNSLGNMLLGLVPSSNTLRKLYVLTTIDSFSWGLGSTLFFGFLVKWYGYEEYRLGLLSGIFTASRNLLSLLVS